MERHFGFHEFPQVDVSTFWLFEITDYKQSFYRDAQISWEMCNSKKKSVNIYKYISKQVRGKSSTKMDQM